MKKGTKSMRSFSKRGFVVGALLALAAGLVKIFFFSGDPDDIVTA